MKPGPKTKDSLVIDNPNMVKKGSKPSSDELRQIKIQQAVADATVRAKEIEIRHLEKEMKELRQDKESDTEIPEDDVKSAYEMLQDMRWVYRSLKGKTKLRDLCKADDKQFLFMIKELMKIESSLKQAEIRKEGTGSGDGRAVFVILKGLDQDRVEVKDNLVDMESLSRVLDPTYVTYSPEERESGNAPPEQIMKKGESI